MSKIAVAVVLFCSFLHPMGVAAQTQTPWPVKKSRTASDYAQRHTYSVKRKSEFKT